MNGMNVQHVEHSSRPERPPASRRTTWRPAVFLDKDGTLVENLPYNVDPARLRFMPQAGPVLRQLAAAGFALVLVSNQSGLARGYFTADDLSRLEAALRQRLLDQHGVHLDAVRWCPHAPDAEGAPRCPCRKPAPGLLLQAAQALALDLRRSWMIGDTLDDVEAGHRAGCRALLFDSGGETLWRPGPLREPQQRVKHWATAGALILADARGWR